MNSRKTRPLLVWIVSILLLLMALSQVTSHTLILLLDPSIQSPQVRAVAGSWSAFDRLAPYLLAGLLIVSTLLLFLMRRRAIAWYSAYLVFVLFTTLQQAATTSWLEVFNSRALLAGLVQLGLFALVLGYMIWLGRRGELS